MKFYQWKKSKCFYWLLISCEMFGKYLWKNASKDTIPSKYSMQDWHSDEHKSNLSRMRKKASKGSVTTQTSNIKKAFQIWQCSQSILWWSLLLLNSRRANSSILLYLVCKPSLEFVVGAGGGQWHLRLWDERLISKGRVFGTRCNVLLNQVLPGMCLSSLYVPAWSLVIKGWWK